MHNDNISDAQITWNSGEKLLERFHSTCRCTYSANRNIGLQLILVVSNWHNHLQDLSGFRKDITSNKDKAESS